MRIITRTERKSKKYGSILENAEKMGAPISPLKNETQDSNDNTNILSL